MWADFLQLLNDNEGVIAFLVLLIALVGFGITNWNIKNSQSQKSGDNNINQQAQGGGFNVTYGKSKDD